MPEIESLVGELTLEEKAALCSGISMWETTPIKRLGIPSIFMADGPHGLRKEREDSKGMFKESHPATCFPTAVTLAASWDPELVAEVGRAIAEECLDQGVAMILGPGVNIKRTPLCGRNFEYFSEDPCLAGELAAAFIRGVQEMGVAVSLKHYAANSQEYRRLTISSEVDERALREIYLKAFETAVKKSRPATIMCSYNLVNGIHASENKKLLWDILRKEWDFDGIVISDWGAVNNRVKGLAAGLDLEMPSSNGIHDQMIVEAVKAGKLDPEVLDRAVARILRFVFKCARRGEGGDLPGGLRKHHQLARRAAASGAVLLKNESGSCRSALRRTLPSSAGWRGNPLPGQRQQPGKPQEAGQLLRLPEAQGIPYAYAPATPSRRRLLGKGDCRRRGAGPKKEYVLVFAGLTDEYESESFDRRHMEMPRGHNELISALAGVSENVIVVLSCGSPVEMPWLDRVGAVLNLYLGGEAAGEAAYDLLFGRVNPSGKLAETFPRRLEDCLGAKYFGMGPRQVHYRESIFVGYRYYDSAQKEVLFPFGHGLSYTRFDYANLELSAKSIDEKGTLTVSFDITNSGDRDGAETAQLYVRDCAATHFVPEKELRAFKKVFLKSGETKRVTLELGREAFAFYNVRTGSWCVETGDFEILVGASSRDIRLRATVRVNAPAVDIEDYREKAPVYYKLAGVEEIPQEQFEALLGRKLPPDLPLRKGELGLNSTIGDLGVSLFGRIFKWAVGKFAPLALARKAAEFEKKMVREGAMSMPLRNLYSMSDGAVPYEAVLGLLEACKGKTVRGLCRFARAMFSRKPPRKADIYR